MNKNDSEATKKAEPMAAVQKVKSVGDKSTSPVKLPPKQKKAKDEAGRNPQSIVSSPKKKAEVAVLDAVKAKKEPKNVPEKVGRSEIPAKK